MCVWTLHRSCFFLSSSSSSSWRVNQSFHGASSCYHNTHARTQTEQTEPDRRRHREEEQRACVKERKKERKKRSNAVTPPYLPSNGVPYLCCCFIAEFIPFSNLCIWIRVSWFVLCKKLYPIAWMLYVFLRVRLPLGAKESLSLSLSVCMAEHLCFWTKNQSFWCYIRS